ncbi:MAG: glycosyltransferase family 29 protein [Octadecabacter sp.]
MNPRVRAFPRKYFLQAPRGWFLKLTRANDARMRALIAGKSVAVVGNAQSLLAGELGDEIDGHDIVIRLNAGVPKIPTSQGARTDMVGLTPVLSEDEMLAGFAPQTLLMLIPKMRHFNIWRRDSVAHTVFYPFRHWLSDQRKIGRRPSSGFMAISWLMRLNAAQSVTLYGFDFGTTATFYNPEGYKTPHDYDAERKIVLVWDVEGILRIVWSH